MRAQAVEGLASVLQEGDSAVASVVAAKSQAAEALAAAASAGTAGGEWIVAALAVAAGDWHAEVRDAALRALAQVATHEAMSADGLAARGAAIQALVPAASRGHSVALRALASQDLTRWRSASGRDDRTNVGSTKLYSDSEKRSLRQPHLN